MAKTQFLDKNGLEELSKHIPILVKGDNIALTQDKDKTNKITISSTLNFETENIDFDTEWDG